MDTNTKITRSYIIEQIKTYLISNFNTQFELKINEHFIKNKDINTNITNKSKKQKKLILSDYSIPLVSIHDKQKRNKFIQDIINHKIKENNIIKQLEFDESKLFLNIYIKKCNNTINILKTFLSKNTMNKFIKNNNKTIIIEFSSPNIAKPFHAGHLRSTIIGNFLSNLYKYFGYNVIKMNYIGDYGKQFGILLLGIHKHNLLNYIYDFDTNNDNIDEMIKKLNDIYIMINKQIKQEQIENQNNISKTDIEAKKYFKQLELDKQKDKKTLNIKIWKKIRKISLIKYNQIYQRLNIEFDIISYESDFYHPAIPGELIDFLEDDNNAIKINLNDYDLGKLTLLKNDNSTLYSLRDINSVIDRFYKYKFDEMLYVVACEQDYYFKQLFKTLELIDTDISEKCEHISFGLVEGMKTRVGKVVLLEDILNTANKYTKEKITNKNVKNINQTSEILGQSAIIIQDFKNNIKRGYKFKWETATSFEGFTGPYIQYTHVRLINIIENATKNGYDNNFNDNDFNDNNFFKLLDENDNNIHYITFKLIEFDEILDKCLLNKDPSKLVIYIFELCKLISRFYVDLNVIHCKDKNIGKLRLLLFIYCQKIISTSLSLLGITPLEKM